MLKSFDEIKYFMSKALDLAYQAERCDEVPVGAIVVDAHGKEIGRGYNQKENSKFVCDHAEIIALKNAAKSLGDWRLENCSLFVTLEPCPMCMSAISQSRIKEVYFGAYDPKGGAISVGSNLHKNPKLNHKVNIFGGFNHIECSKQLSNFFKLKRKNFKKITS